MDVYLLVKKLVLEVQVIEQIYFTSKGNLQYLKHKFCCCCVELCVSVSCNSAPHQAISCVR